MVLVKAIASMSGNFCWLFGGGNNAIVNNLAAIDQCAEGVVPV